jgi:hypothetical protein
MEFLVATPLGVLIVFCAVGGLVMHTSAGVVIVAAIALMFGVAVLASCAYSVWGTCSVVIGSDECVVTRTLWGRRRVWRFAASRIRSVFLYDPPPAYIMWPGLSGAHVRVAVDRWSRSVPVASGLYAPREMLDRIRVMFLRAAEDAGVVAPGGAGPR